MFSKLRRSEIFVKKPSVKKIKFDLKNAKNYAARMRNFKGERGSL